MFVSVKFIDEPKAGGKWKKQFENTWPHYKKWFTQEGMQARSGYLSSSKAIKETMPEIFPIYEKLSELAGGGDLVSRYLSLYNPPAFMSGCTQIGWTFPEPCLIRNYDYNPKLFEGVLLKSSWLKPVIGMVDCNWGLLDGMNLDGLAISLTFGGRKVVGKGFGIPLIMRYVLETCSDVKSAVEAFKVVPCHMVYNVTLTDKGGQVLSLFLGPDREIGIRNAAICTNHQEMIDWPEYAEMTATVEREAELLNYLHFESPTNTNLINKFLHPPLYTIQPKNSYATLYTAAYFPSRGTLSLFWPAKQFDFGFDSFNEGKTMVHLGKSVTGKMTL